MLDRAHLAWAAGLFEAEGCTTLIANARPGWRHLRVQVAQSVEGGGIELLARFHRSVGSVGKVIGPNRHGMCYFQTTNIASALEVIESMLPWLGPVKREQFRRCGDVVLDQFLSRKPIGRRSVQRRRNRDQLSFLLREIRSAFLGSKDVESSEALAWAAGLFEGDGSIGASAMLNSEGYGSVLLRASVAQSSADGVPDVLRRFLSVMGFGKIQGPYAPRRRGLPQYQWILQKPSDVLRFVELLRPYLGGAKLGQADRAISRYAECRAALVARQRRPRRLSVSAFATAGPETTMTEPSVASAPAG